MAPWETLRIFHDYFLRNGAISTGCNILGMILFSVLGIAIVGASYMVFGSDLYRVNSIEKERLGGHEMITRNWAKRNRKTFVASNLAGGS